MGLSVQGNDMVGLKITNYSSFKKNRMPDFHSWLDY